MEKSVPNKIEKQTAVLLSNTGIKNQDSNWKLSKISLPNVPMKEYSRLNMLMTDEMFNRLENIFGAKKVSGSIRYLIDKAVAIFDKVESFNSNWKIFQYLKKEKKKELTENEQKSSEIQVQAEKNPKKRKHEFHFVCVTMDYYSYSEIKKLHYRINTFSMAIIIRMICEVFFGLYDKYGDENEALNHLKDAIEALLVQKEICFTANFKCYSEYNDKLQLNRYAIVFELAYFNSNVNSSFAIRFKL